MTKEDGIAVSEFDILEQNDLIYWLLLSALVLMGLFILLSKQFSSIDQGQGGGVC